MASLLPEQHSQLRSKAASVAKLTERSRSAGVGKVEIDLLFIIDVTDSMQPYIDEAKSSMRNVVDEITTRYGDNAALRLAVMAYRDIEDVKPREVLDFTSSVDKCTRFIAKLRACTTTAPVPEDCKDNKSWKADWPEDLTGAMKDSTNLRWRSKTRCAIVITDAPCHGKEFYSMANWGRADRDAANAGTSTDGWVRNGAVLEGSTGTIKADEVDNHPNGDPRGLDPRRVVLDLRRCNVDLHFFRVYYHTDVMVEQLAGAYDKPARGYPGGFKYKLHVHEMGCDTSLFVGNVLKSVNRSLSSSSARSTFGQQSGVASFMNTKRKFRPSLTSIAVGALEEVGALDEEGQAAEEPAEPDEQGWGPKETVEVFTATSKGKSVGTLEIRVQERPFSEGAMRVASYAKCEAACRHQAILMGLTTRATPTFVVKEAKKKGAKHNSKEAQLADLDSLKAAQALAAKWNDEVPGARIEFLNGFALHFPNRACEDSSWLAAEPKLPDEEFVKFNNNAGYVEVSDDAELPNCFSHWTWQQTNAEIMVLDMQGVVKSDGTYCCTDPQVQHSDTSRYGHGNLGQKGMADFFAAHRCGDMCRALNLRPPDEATVVSTPTVVATLIPELAQVVPDDQQKPVNFGNGPIERPSWVPDHDVYRCQIKASAKCQARGGQKFSLVHRRHHCRACGNVTCDACSPGRMPLPYSEKPGELQRVCLACSSRFTGVHLEKT